MFGVLKSRPPQAERSPYPRSSARITTTFGFLCRCCAESAAAPKLVAHRRIFLRPIGFSPIINYLVLSGIDISTSNFCQAYHHARSAEQWYVVALIVGGFI